MYSVHTLVNKILEEVLGSQHGRLVWSFFVKKTQERQTQRVFVPIRMWSLFVCAALVYDAISTSQKAVSNVVVILKEYTIIN